MSKEKQIEEMARTLCGEKEITCRECDSYDACEFWVEASVLYNAGYRKQSEGEWVKTQFVARTGFYTIKEFPCNQCGEKFEVAKGNELMHFCPNCGAKMKGGGE